MECILLCHFISKHLTAWKKFKPIFLRFQKSKFENFSAHQKENFLNFSKLTLLLVLVPFLLELWPIQTWKRFCLGHPV